MKKLHYLRPLQTCLDVPLRHLQIRTGFMPLRLPLRTLIWKHIKQSRAFSLQDGSDLSPMRYLDPSTSNNNNTTNESLDSASTLTVSERATFEQLFKTRDGESTSARSLEVLDVNETDELIGNISNGDSLDAIFEREIANSRLTGTPCLSPDFLESQLNNTLGGKENVLFPESNKNIPGLSSGSEGSHRATLVLSNERAKQRESLTTGAQQKIIARVNMLFSSAGSDTEVWQILNTEVFSQMRTIDSSLKHNFPISNGNPSIESNSNQLPPSDENPATKGRLSPLPEVQPLSLLGTNYTIHCVTALRTLRRRFPYSSYATAVLPGLKSFGPIGYALGASTALYNELLYIRWVFYKDLNSCADLVAEMLDRGVATDMCTHSVFRDAQRQRRKLERFRNAQSLMFAVPNDVSNLFPKINSESLKEPSDQGAIESKVSTLVDASWWGLEGVRSGWRRWEEVEEQALTRFYNDLESCEQRRQENIAIPDEYGDE